MMETMMDVKKTIVLFVSVFFLFLVSACSKDADDEYLEDFYENYDEEAIDESRQTNTLVVAQWNIGHFSNGVSQNSSIKGTNYNIKKEQFGSFLSKISADIISINEYSVCFGTDENNVTHDADKELFSDYSNSFIGHQSRYSCNAIFSKTPLLNAQELSYECNQTAIITHTNAIKATDYYILESHVNIDGLNIVFVSTHLAFDKNDGLVARNQIEEIIKLYDGEERVILCGDWNVKDTDDFNMFVDAGYSLANHGKFGDFKTRSKSIIDNIIVKGFEIKKIYVKDTSLSDHRPIVAYLRISNS